jgi:hypothetical protein
MRDRRYVLTRRRSGRFERTDVAGFKLLDDIERRWERASKPPSTWPSSLPYKSLELIRHRDGYAYGF